MYECTNMVKSSVNLNTINMSLGLLYTVSNIDTNSDGRE